MNSSNRTPRNPGHTKESTEPGAVPKGKREVERGYTTAANVAKQNKDLYLVHWRTLRTISAPGEDRPAGLIL
jgi:hypothetical protein